MFVVMDGRLTVDVIAHILSFMELDNTYEIHNEIELTENTYLNENNPLQVNLHNYFW